MAVRQSGLRDRTIADREIKPAGQNSIRERPTISLDDAKLHAGIVLQIAIEHGGQRAAADRRHHAGANEARNAPTKVSHLLRRGFQAAQEALAELVVVISCDRWLNALCRALEQFDCQLLFELSYLHRQCW